MVKRLALTRRGEADISGVVSFKEKDGKQISRSKRRGEKSSDFPCEFLEKLIGSEGESVKMRRWETGQSIRRKKKRMRPLEFEMAYLPRKGDPKEETARRGSRFSLALWGINEKGGGEWDNSMWVLKKNAAQEPYVHLTLRGKKGRGRPRSGNPFSI